MQVDDAAAPLDFVYVTSHVAGEKVVLSNFGWFNPTLKVSRYKRKTWTLTSHLYPNNEGMLSQW